MRYEFRRIGDGRQAVLCETKRAVTPFGGLVVLIELMRQVKLLEAVRAALPFRYTSNNAIAPEHTLLAFWLGVAVGAKRFAHLQMLRCDRALQELCGVRAFPGDDTVRNFFGRFGQAQINDFFTALWQWLFNQMPSRSGVLDLDSTIFQRYGRQEGAERGFNRIRRNGRSHHPLLAFISEPVLVLHGWLRAGHAADSRGAVEFLQEALAHLPKSWTLLGVRADAGFFDQVLLDFLEQRVLPYIIVAKRQPYLQRMIGSIREWTKVDEQVCVAEFTARLHSWSRARRFIVVRVRLPDPKEQRLIDVPGYEFRLMVTNRDEAPEWLWRHYDQRAAIEPRISELKTDLGADDFCMKKFYPTEAAFRSVLFVFNLLSWLQSLQSKPTQQRPATVRSSLFTCGAIAGRSGHKMVLYLSQSWGGLVDRMSILESILPPPPSTSPK
jgi:hypothetical protein